MKIFRFVKKVFFTGLIIPSNFTNAIPLSCISMNNQECKTRLQVINVNGDKPVLFHLVLKQVNVVVVVILLTIRMQILDFLMLQKI